MKFVNWLSRKPTPVTTGNEPGTENGNRESFDETEFSRVKGPVAGDQEIVHPPMIKQREMAVERVGNVGGEPMKSSETDVGEPIKVDVFEQKQRLTKDESEKISVIDDTMIGSHQKRTKGTAKFERTILQIESLPGRKQVRNDAGGYVWRVDNLTRLKRFISLGSESAVYSKHAGGSSMMLDANSNDLNDQNVNALSCALEEGRGLEVVRILKAFSVGGRTAKQDNILFCLAFCVKCGNAQVKKTAYEAMPEICRIPTHLFVFIRECQKLSLLQTTKKGWGRAHRRAVCNWYTQYADDPAKLALHITKYKNRAGWSHRDVLRLCHVTPETDELNALFRYVTRGLNECESMIREKEFSVNPNFEAMMEFLRAVERATVCRTDAEEIELIGLIQRYRLVREHVPTEMLKSAAIWLALLEDMPMEAMIRNVGRMTSIGALRPGSEQEARVAHRLRDEQRLKDACIHPFKLLVAFLIYKQGRGDKGNLEWAPCPKISDSLMNAFYSAFEFVEPTGKRFCLAMDVSGSMTWCSMMGIDGLTPRVAASCMMMVTAKRERNHEILGFSEDLVPIDISADDDLRTVTRKVSRIRMGSTDCAAPILWATTNKKQFDVFVVYTDSETAVGPVHPSEALKRYRLKSGRDARLIVCAMTSNGFTLADPEDKGMLDMTGFDTEAPGIIRDFSCGYLD
ncbi:RNA-binding protein RO60-like isoform X2 [Tubulanus polymorphus]|uniref:RNA-binding protein RO60-like isoform X2 n=1 Tax=Tubulanus polymorphus TaxID=672921 RepID=UPI003DA26238